MVLRYYQWLPLELEPDYEDGYTCDHCRQDFCDAPFFHEEATGTDYCINCGTAAGYTPHTGLVSSLLFSSMNDVLRDADTHDIVSFAYKLDTMTLGVFFVSGANLVLNMQIGGGLRDGLYFTVKNDRVHSKLRIPREEVIRRLPWLPHNFSDIFDIEIKLHTPPDVPIPLNDICVVSYAANEDRIHINFTNNYRQLLDIHRGEELVARETMAVCLFSAESVKNCTKIEANGVLHPTGKLDSPPHKHL